jgi:hypothetical protein
MKSFDFHSMIDSCADMRRVPDDEDDDMDVESTSKKRRKTRSKFVAKEKKVGVHARGSKHGHQKKKLCEQKIRYPVCIVEGVPLSIAERRAQRLDHLMSVTHMMKMIIIRNLVYDEDKPQELRAECGEIFAAASVAFPFDGVPLIKATMANGKKQGEMLVRTLASEGRIQRMLREARALGDLFDEKSTICIVQGLCMSILSCGAIGEALDKITVPRDRVTMSNLMMRVRVCVRSNKVDVAELIIKRYGLIEYAMERCSKSSYSGYMITLISFACKCSAESGIDKIVMDEMVPRCTMLTDAVVKRKVWDACISGKIWIADALCERFKMTGNRIDSRGLEYHLDRRGAAKKRAGTVKEAIEWIHTRFPVDVDVDGHQTAETLRLLDTAHFIPPENIGRIANVVAIGRYGCEFDLRDAAVVLENSQFHGERFCALSAVIRFGQEKTASILLFKTGAAVSSGTKTEEDALISLEVFGLMLRKIGYDAILSEFEIKSVMYV